MFLYTPAVRQLIRLSLQEDSAHSDVTTRTLIDASWRAQAVIVAKQTGIISGLPLVRTIFQSLDPKLNFRSLAEDGAQVRRGQRLALIEGRARSILSAERPALNALQHLSGIATFTRAQVQKLKGTRVRLFDTRKTLPGWRLLQKYAVRCGGGHNHRLTLSAEPMIKENHLKIARLAGKDWIKAAAPLSAQMEIQTEADLKDALRLKPKRVLLDNRPPRTIRRMIRVLRKAVPGIEIELTGGIRPDNLRRYARLGADRISMGALTHSVKAFDCSLDITHVHS